MPLTKVLISVKTYPTLSERYDELVCTAGFLEDGSYFRLRSLQIGYTIPVSLFKGLIQKARVYVNAENLFTITSYTGYTPDVNASSVYSRGFDEFIYPSNRTFMLGLNVTF